MTKKFNPKDRFKGKTPISEEELTKLIQVALSNFLVMAPKDRIEAITKPIKTTIRDNYISHQEIRHIVSHIGLQLREIDIPPRKKLKSEKERD